MDIEILNEDRLRGWYKRISGPEGGVEPLIEMARAIRLDPALSQVFVETYEKTVLKGDWHREWSEFPFDPQVEKIIGERASLFYYLGYLAALPHAEREYQRRGIGMDIFDATMADLGLYYADAYEKYGAWRYDNFQWVWRHLSCELFRLGRLQFMLLPFYGRVSAFRNVHDGEIRLLCDPDLEQRADGYAEGAGGQPSGQETWRTMFEESLAGWRGNLVAPRGFALREPVFLSKQEWTMALRAGDTVLDIHIPRGQSLTVEDCRESFRQAFDFFAAQAPERPFKASFCHTWFFTPQLQQILPPVSNIVRFQREFYLYPYPGGPGFLWSYVFGEKSQYPHDNRRDTSLRRAVLDWVERGGELFDLPGLMFHGPDEYGTQPYMRSWEANAASR